MTTVFMTDEVTGHFALFDLAPGGGDVEDRNALMHRPLLDPENWLPNIYIHSALDLMEVESETVVTVSHAAIAAGSNTTGIELASPLDYDAGVTDHDVLTHDLGYEPLVMVVVGSERLTPGQPVQGPGSTGGTVRYVSPHVTSAKVYLREYASRGNTGLASVDIDYRVLVIRRPRPASGNRLMDLDPETETIAMGFDRFNADRRYLQVVPGGTPFGICLGRNADSANGAPRFISADGSVFDPVPSTVKMGIKAAVEGSVTYGAAMDYTGSFVGTGSIQVQAP